MGPYTKMTIPLLAEPPACLATLTSQRQDPNLSVCQTYWQPSMLDLIKCYKLPSETISGQGILIGSIYLLYLHSPSPFKLCYWSWPRSRRFGIKVGGEWMGECRRRRRRRRGRIRTQRKRFPLGVSRASFLLFSIWPWSWLYCSMLLPLFQHIVNDCQYFQRKLVTAFQWKL